MVDLADDAQGPRPARVVGEIPRPSLEHAAAAGWDVLVVMAGEAPAQPYVLGVVQPPPSRAPARAAFVERDGDRVTIQGEREIVLQCGDARVVLRRDGKILIHGRDVTSRARRRHRIRGGTVEIN